MQKSILALSLACAAACHAPRVATEISAQGSPMTEVAAEGCNLSSSDAGRFLPLEGGLEYRWQLLGDGPLLDPESGAEVLVIAIHFELRGPDTDRVRISELVRIAPESNQALRYALPAVNLGPLTTSETVPTADFTVLFEPTAGGSWGAGPIVCSVTREP